MMLSNNVLLFIVVSFYRFILLVASEPRVDLPIGSLVGRDRITVAGRKYYSYQSIPFAEPPVGSLRFLDPVEKKPWKGTLNATRYRSLCYQMTNSFSLENEDCLFVNVYTPVSPSERRYLPVMFFIPGGAFTDGGATELIYGPQHLIEKDIVIVETNYRLGAFGFLSTGDTVIPGNAGLKDQVLALKWTKKYIKYFGGDPRRVTVFGQSSGAASVSYHLLSPVSKGLFNAAIAESGSALSYWALNTNQTKISFNLANLISKDEYSKINSSSTALLKYLQSVPAARIRDAAVNSRYPGYNPVKVGFLFAPVIEAEHDKAFFTGKQYEQFKKGHYNKVPIMMGINSQEQLEVLNNPDFETYLNLSEKHPECLIPSGMNVRREDRAKVAKAVYEFYSPNETFIENPLNLVHFSNDDWFARPIHKAAQLQSKHANVWFYKFSYKGPMANLVSAPVLGFAPNVTHSEELSYIFAMNFANHNTTDVSKYPKPDILVHQRLVAMWSNFAKTHNPTPTTDERLQNITWPRFDTSSEKYLDIGSDLKVKSFPNYETLKFWEDLYNKYGRPPYDTY